MRRCFYALILLIAGCEAAKPTDRTSLAIDQAQASAEKIAASADDAAKHNTKVIAALERERDAQAKRVNK